MLHLRQSALPQYCESARGIARQRVGRGLYGRNGPQERAVIVHRYRTSSQGYRRPIVLSAHPGSARSGSCLSPAPAPGALRYEQVPRIADGG